MYVHVFPVYMQCIYKTIEASNCIHLYTLYVMYRQYTYKYKTCICNVYTCIYWIQLIVNRVLGSTEGCRTEGCPLSCGGGWGWGDWESDLCRGVMRARCYPFDMPKHRFHWFNPQVLVHTLHRHVNTCYIHVCIILFGTYTYKHYMYMYISCLWCVSINVVYTSKNLVYKC